MYGYRTEGSALWAGNDRDDFDFEQQFGSREADHLHESIPGVVSPKYLARTCGREYLFGLVMLDSSGAAIYRSFWAFTERDERPTVSFSSKPFERSP